MPGRSKILSGTLITGALLLTSLGLSGVAMSAAEERADTAQAAPAAVHLGHRMAPSTATSSEDADGDGYITAATRVDGVGARAADPPHRYFHEFQANCSVSHTRPDDPIVYPQQPGKSHDHTFMGNTTTNAASTTASLSAGTTTCKAPGDKSGYWMPTLLKGDQPVRPIGPQTIYYKAGVTDYTSVRPFPKGLRYVVGSPTQTAQEFRNHPGFVEGWECGDSFFNVEFPANCPSRADVQLNIRMQAPSCWDGVNLDSPDHKSHMSYTVVKPGTNDNMCPADHPVALPMIEFKMAFPVNGDLSQVKLASGPSWSFHYDFFNAWDDATLKALVDHCIVGGLQCDARGYDQTHPEAGAALNEKYELP
ncbi:DUF1996 domain-containing protein [Streptomyces griseoviridis]|uniref:DUF1996 domain-containing protein n=2 Tax=Streptomyces TaxID=1883 RepID=A0A3S9ZP37_STRGD|nr:MULTISPECIES: DUF1996 domain-containing protein [Streptomyces]AZS89372.1 DUF1996 domain-containing protein [Streptomyces griseoviridis]MDH6699365.1 hypothetical protein [Streptomyces sp. MAA16]MDT0474498.1 DUF1996 domain-containing protein [Streptomyces sp. DSM 41014]QCN83783.1 hypothetical protein DDJ31_01400 [Streptomyces griseoviridis]